MSARAGIVLFFLSTAGIPARAVEQGLEIRTWLDAYRSGDPSRQGWFRETYFLSAQPAPWVFVTFTPVVERDSHGDVARDVLYDDTDRDLARAALRFRDLAVGFRLGGTTVVVGKQRLTWGRTSFVNATDNLAPHDWTDPLDEVRLAPWAADATWERGHWHVQCALVPRYAPSRLPALLGRWFQPEPKTVVNPGYPKVGPPILTLDFAWGTADFPSVTWDTLQGALRAGFRGQHGEVQVSYFRGYDDAPAIVPRSGTPDFATGHLPIYLDRSFLRLEVSGLDGEVLIGAWSLRAEAGYFHYSSGAADDYLLGQAEAEWSRGGWRLDVGYADTSGGQASTTTSTALDQAFVPSAFVRVAKGDATEWQIALDAAIGAKHLDSLVRLSGSVPLIGHMRVGGEVDVIDGDADTFWGRWRDNDRVRAFLQLNF